MTKNTKYALVFALVVLLALGFYLGWLDNGPKPLF